MVAHAQNSWGASKTERPKEPQRHSQSECVCFQTSFLQSDPLLQCDEVNTELRKTEE